MDLTREKATAIVRKSLRRTHRMMDDGASHLPGTALSHRGRVYRGNSGSLGIF